MIHVKELVIIVWKRKNETTMEGVEKVRLSLDECDKVTMTIEEQKRKEE
jgi:hypothetical protein